MPDARAVLLRQGLTALHINAEQDQIAVLLSYLDLIEHWNRQINLTSVRTPRDMVIRHLLDSLAVAPWVNQSQVLDIGSGAGLPGIPLAILHPEQSWHLLDSSGKRAGFLREACRRLELKNVQVIQERVENHRADEGYPAVIARAFASLGEIADNAAHLLLPQGYLWAMKGRYPHEELAALPAAFQLREVISIQVPGLEEDRHLVQLAFEPEP